MKNTINSESCEARLEYVQQELDAAYERELELYGLLKRRLNRAGLLLLPAIYLISSVFYPDNHIGERIITGIAGALIVYVVAKGGLQMETRQPYTEKCKACGHLTYLDPNGFGTQPCRYCGKANPLSV